MTVMTDFKSYKVLIFIGILVAVLSISCSRVDYGIKEDRPDHTRLFFNLQWETDARDVPEELAVIMSRIINTVHYGWIVDSTGTVLGSPLDTPVPEIELPDQDTSASEGFRYGTAADLNALRIRELHNSSLTKAESAEEGQEESAEEGQEETSESDSTATELTEMDILNGEYYVMTFNRNINNFNIDQIKEFVVSEEISMKELIASSPAVSQEHLDEVFGEKMADFNPLYGFIFDVGPLYLDVKKQTVQPDLSGEIVLNPHTLTQNLTFEINVQVEEGVEIRSILGEISGVPGEIELMSGYVSDSTTYRVLFDFLPTDIVLLDSLPRNDYVTDDEIADDQENADDDEIADDPATGGDADTAENSEGEGTKAEGDSESDESGESDDSEEGGEEKFPCRSVTYQGNVDVLGLFPARDSAFITGPGILHVTIHARTKSPSGRTYDRLFHSGINIAKTIENAALMELNESTRTYRARKAAAVLKVKSILKVFHDQVQPGGGGQGVEIWVNKEENNFEVDM